MTWQKTNLHAWTHGNGWKISRHWTLTKPKIVYFLTYASQDDYWQGINMGSFSSLKEAKNSFKNLLEKA